MKSEGKKMIRKKGKQNENEGQQQTKIAGFVSKCFSCVHCFSCISVLSLSQVFCSQICVLFFEFSGICRGFQFQYFFTFTISILPLICFIFLALFPHVCRFVYAFIICCCLLDCFFPIVFSRFDLFLCIVCFAFYFFGKILCLSLRSSPPVEDNPRPWIT